MARCFHASSLADRVIYFFRLTPRIICHSPRSFSRSPRAWVQRNSPRSMSIVAGSGFAASSKCGRNVPLRTVTACGTVIASNPSAPCVTPQPLAPAPAERRRGVRRWGEHVVDRDVPGGDARGQFLRGFDVGREDRRGQPERAIASPSDTASSSAVERDHRARWGEAGLAADRGVGWSVEEKVWGQRVQRAAPVFDAVAARQTSLLRVGVSISLPPASPAPASPVPSARAFAASFRSCVRERARSFARCTKMRRTAMHVCPRLSVTPNHAARAAISTSASASTNIASQPESSSVEGTSRSPSRAASFRPTASEPVKTM